MPNPGNSLIPRILIQTPSPRTTETARVIYRCDAAIYGLKEVPGLPMATRSVCNRRGLDGGQFLLAGIRLKAGMTDC